MRHDAAFLIHIFLVERNIPSLHFMGVFLLGHLPSMEAILSIRSWLAGFLAGFLLHSCRHDALHYPKSIGLTSHFKAGLCVYNVLP